MAGWDVFVADLTTGDVRHTDPEGSRQGLPTPFSPPTAPGFAYVSASADGKGDIWLMNPDGSGKERLTERPETWDYFPGLVARRALRRLLLGHASITRRQGSMVAGPWWRSRTKADHPALFSSGARDVFPDWR